MSLDTLKDALPPYARDLAANLAVVTSDDALGEQQKWGCLIACAYAGGSRDTIRALLDGCPLADAAADAAKAAAALMAMNNIYYRALHTMRNREYTTMPSKLRMGAITTPGAPKLDFELWCLAVSAMNGCAACVDSHESVLRTHGVRPGVVQGALRIAAVIGAVSRVMIAEAAAKDDG